LIRHLSLASALTFLAHWASASLAMFWAVLWSLLLGFILSAMVQAYVSKGGLAKLLGRAGLRELALSTALGAASSSCSYAAAATAKSIFKRGADFSTAMVFMFASTNLVIELGLVLWRLLGWPFVLAEWVGGLVLIAVFALLSKWLISAAAVEAGRRHVEMDAGEGAHEHHGELIAPGATLAQKLRSGDGWRYVSHYFQMDWSMLQTDLIAGFVIAGLLAVAVPPGIWQHLFLAGAPTGVRVIENALVGPIVAILSFVCSIGNVPLAAVLWSGGSSFGGVIAFLYADLIVLPLIDVYRKYYGWPLALRMVGVFYLSMVVAALAVERIYAALHAVPPHAANLLNMVEHIGLDYTTALNVVLLATVGILIWWGRRAQPRGHPA